MKKISAPAEHHFYLQNSDETQFAKDPLKAFSDDKDRLTLASDGEAFANYVEGGTVPEGKARDQVLSFMPEVSKDGQGQSVDMSLPVNAALSRSNGIRRCRDGSFDPPPSARPRPPRAGAPNGAIGIARLSRQGRSLVGPLTVNMDWTSWPGSPATAR